MFVNLGNEPGSAENRPRHQLGEEGHEEEEIGKAVYRLKFPVEDVQGVAHRLEGEEGYPHGQENIQGGQIASEKAVYRIDEEIGILVIAQGPKVPNHAECDKQPSPALAFGVFQAKTD